MTSVKVPVEKRKTNFKHLTMQTITNEFLTILVGCRFDASVGKINPQSNTLVTIVFH